MLQTLITKLNERDPLIAGAGLVAREALDEVLEALRYGDRASAEAALLRHDTHVRELVENLRVYQAELHAQADELASSQKRTEQALRDFSMLFSHMPVAVLRVAMNGEVLDYNSRARDLFDLHPSAARSRFLHRLVSAGDYQDTVRPAFHEARATGWSVIKSAGLLTERGRPFEGEVHVAAIHASPDHAPQFACAFLDRTEQLQTLRTLQQAIETTRRSEAFLADSARLARIGGWEFHVGTRSLRWSREMCALFDVPEGSRPGSKVALGLCRAEGRRDLGVALRRAIQTGTPFELEIDMQSRGGRPMRVQILGHADMDGGRCQRVAGVCQDITGQHQARQQIGDLTERLSLAHEAGGIGVWDWDHARSRLYFDARMAGLLDLAPDDVLRSSLQETLRERLAGNDAARLDAAVARALDAREPFDLEVRVSHQGAGFRYLHLAGRGQFDDAGTLQRLVGLARDCTTAKEAALLTAAKESAEFASRAKSAFLSRMSHELRTPLNAILGFSQLMRLEAAAGDLTVKPHRAVYIETAARHLLDLINEVLDVSRIESGQLVLNMTRIDLRQIVEETLPMVIGQAQDVGLRIEDLTARRPPLWVRSDRLRLKEVLINLLSNAVKYNRPGGLVRIEAQDAEGGQVKLSISDTGRGLDADQRAGLFQPFNRVGAEATGIEGSGMGLFVSKRFIELMGGSIEVRSERGVGTCFSVFLEAVEAS